MTNKNEVGYKNPPKHTRFKKGESGNPNGRPKKKLEDPQEILGKVLKEQAIVSINGEKHKMSQQEIYIRQIHKKATEGNSQCIKIVNEWMKGAVILQDMPQIDWQALSRMRR